jgi:hypothetical protein
MSDLLWYFQRPNTEMSQSLTYIEFFSRYYLETLPLSDPLNKGQILMTHVDTNQGLRQKVIQQTCNWRYCYPNTDYSHALQETVLPTSAATGTARVKLSRCPYYPRPLL